MRHAIKKILAAVDLSEPSLNALNTAVFLAEKCKAMLYMMYVKEDIHRFIGLDKPAVQNKPDHSEDILTALSHDIHHRTRRQPVVIRKEGHATQEILKSAVKHHCDLIVAGTSGMSGFREGSIGGHASAILKYAPCSVLTVPQGKKWNFFKKLLFPVRPAITSLRYYDILHNFLLPDSVLCLLGFSPSGHTGAIRDLDNLIAGVSDRIAVDNITVQAEWTSKTPVADNVLKYAEENKADLIVITPAIDVSPKQFYIGPNAHRIIHNARVPVLSINKQAYL